MKQDASNRNSDLKVIALLAVMVAGLAGLIGILIADPSIDGSQLHPIRGANAAVPRVKVETAETTGTKPVTPEENWAADESSHGMRPDAAN